jgi:NitT/TauT family transport system permease protein
MNFMSEADVVRPDVLRPTVDASQFGVVQRPLSIGERIYNIGAVRKLAILVLLAIAWEIYARWLHNDLLFPTFGATLRAFAESMISGGLLGKAWTSIKVLLIGYSAGIALAAVLTTVAIP